MQIRRLFDIPAYQEINYPQRTALAYRDSMRWRKYATHDIANRVDTYSAGLLELGAQRGELAALLADSGHPDWVFLDLALQQIGLVVLPLHADWSVARLQAILDREEIKWCFVQNRETYEKIDRLRSKLVHLRAIYALHPLPDKPNIDQLRQPPTGKHLEAIQSRRASVHSDDTALLFCKESMEGDDGLLAVTHRQIIGQILALTEALPIHCDNRAVSLLPPNLLYERILQYTYLAQGVGIFFSSRPNRILEEMREIRPHFALLSPPQLKQLYRRIRQQGASGIHPEKGMVRWAVKLGEEYGLRRRSSLWYWLKLTVANTLVYRYWRQRMGGKIEALLVAGDMPNPYLVRLFSATGLDVRTALFLPEYRGFLAMGEYGRQTQSPLALSRLLPGLSLRIAAGNNTGRIEIQTRMESTADWHPTSLIGQEDRQGWIVPIGVESEFIRLQDGSIVNPRPIEQLLELHPEVEHALVVGAGRLQPAVLIVPSKANTFEPSPASSELTALLNDHIEKINSMFENQPAIHAFRIIEESWTIESGNLLSNQAPNRQFILERNRRLIETLYATNL